MTSCRILSCPSDIAVKPIRFAGTWSTYSNSAMPQDTSAATYQGFAERSFRCAYQAKVMKTFDAASMSAVSPNTPSGIAGAVTSGHPFASLVFQGAKAVLRLTVTGNPDVG